MTRKELKKLALATLKEDGNWSYGIVTTLVLWAMTIGIGVFVSKATIIVPLLGVGLQMAFLAMSDGNRVDGKLSAVFMGFTNQRFVPVFVSYLLITIAVGAGYLILLIPGIFLGISFSQTYYVIYDSIRNGESIGVTDALKKSWNLMSGHRWEYFVLQLSFLGWMILAIIPIGLGFLVLLPYMRVTDAKFYRYLLGDDTSVGDGVPTGNSENTSEVEQQASTKKNDELLWP